MYRVIFTAAVASALLLWVSPQATARDLCCFGRTEKKVTGVCFVQGFQEGRICIEEPPNNMNKACWGISGCFELKDHGGAKVGDRVIVTGWRAGDMKCYQGPNCGKVSVVGSTGASEGK